MQRKKVCNNIPQFFLLFLLFDCVSVCCISSHGICGEIWKSCKVFWSQSLALSVAISGSKIFNPCVHGEIHSCSGCVYVWGGRIACTDSFTGRLWRDCSNQHHNGCHGHQPWHLTSRTLCWRVHLLSHCKELCRETKSAQLDIDRDLNLIPELWNQHNSQSRMYKWAPQMAVL